MKGTRELTAAVLMPLVLALLKDRKLSKRELDEIVRLAEQEDR